MFYQIQYTAEDGDNNEDGDGKYRELTPTLLQRVHEKIALLYKTVEFENTKYTQQSQAPNDHQ
jgi:hypothetical protein